MDAILFVDRAPIGSTFVKNITSLIKSFSIPERLSVIDPLMKIANTILTIQSKPLLTDYPDIKRLMYDTNTKYPLFYVI